MPRIEGTYRVSINGFICNRQTWDNAFPIAPEGHGDEIFLQIEYRTLDANGNKVGQPVTHTTMTIGSRGSGRYEFGSATNAGGIATGDRFPNATPSDRGQANLNTPDKVPPIKIWEGKLVSDWVNPGQAHSPVTHEEVVLITPTIWEWDEGTNAIDGWVAWQVATDARFGKQAEELVAGVYPLAKVIFPMVSLGIQTGGSLGAITGRAGTRPIGMTKDNGYLALEPQVLDLSQARAYQISRQDLGYGPGIVPFRYKDDEDFKGDYTLFLQVERLGVEREIGSSQPASSTSTAPISTTPLSIAPPTLSRRPGN